MREDGFAGDGMPWVARLFAKPDRYADDHRRRKFRESPPAHRTAIVDLLGRGIGVLAKLNFRHRLESGDRHPDRAANDAFFAQRSIEHTPFAETDLQIDRRAVYAA